MRSPTPSIRVRLTLWYAGALGRGHWGVENLVCLLVGLAVLGLYFLDVNEILLLFAGGVIIMLVANLRRIKHPGASSLFIPALGELKFFVPLALAAVPFSLPLLFLTFLKIGSVLYGSNEVRQAGPTGLWTLLWESVKSPMMVLLLSALGIAGHSRGHQRPDRPG